MIICKILLPITYSLFIGGAYGIVCKRKFGHSLMMAYCIQVLLLLLSGMTFKNLLFGIYAGVIFSIFGVAFGMWRDRRKFPHTLKTVLCERSTVCFIILAIGVFIINYGKHYAEWDEFSHWGRFLKESCKLNQLYVMSSSSMAHKDYVPAVTLFEYLWCKLSLAYSEANGYRGIQMLLVAVVLMVASEIKTAGRKVYQIVVYSISVIILMGIPLLFWMFNFYRSIYEDAIFGILLFAAIWVALHDSESVVYRSFSLTMALSMAIMCKMTAVPFVLLIWLFYLWNEQKIGRKFQLNWRWQIIPLVLPFGVWRIFNCFVAEYMNTGGTQSYSGYTLTGILKVLLHDGSVSWQMDVERKFWKAVFTRGLLGGMSFVAVCFVLLGLALMLRKKNIESDAPYRNVVTGKHMLIWAVGATIAYALMMCFLYDIAFVEYEARKLASYDRYMSSWLIAIVYLFVSLALVRCAGEKVLQQTVLLTMLSFVAVVDNRNQLLSGLKGESSYLYEGESNLINSVLQEDESVLVIERGSNSWASVVIGFYCMPREVGFSSPGPAVYDGDIFSSDMAKEELSELIHSYDYVYVIHVDENFVKKYEEIVPEITQNTENILYKVTPDGKLQQVAE